MKKSEKIKQEVEIENEDGFVDNFVVKINDLEFKNVIHVEMPKMNIELINNLPVVEKSCIILTLTEEENICSNILDFSKKMLNNFTIDVLSSDNNKTFGKWCFYNSYIKSIDFGFLGKEPNEQQRMFRCEIDYKFLTINGINIG